MKNKLNKFKTLKPKDDKIERQRLLHFRSKNPTKTSINDNNQR